MGVVPERFRSRGKKRAFCFVFSKFPPTIQLDKRTLQRESGARINPSEPIQARVMKTTFPKMRFKTPRFIKDSSAEDMGVVAAGVGLGTLGLSSFALIL